MRFLTQFDWWITARDIWPPTADFQTPPRLGKPIDHSLYSHFFLFLLSWQIGAGKFADPFPGDSNPDYLALGGLGGKLFCQYPSPHTRYQRIEVLRADFRDIWPHNGVLFLYLFRGSWILFSRWLIFPSHHSYHRSASLFYPMPILQCLSLRYKLLSAAEASPGVAVSP